MHMVGSAPALVSFGRTWSNRILWQFMIAMFHWLICLPTMMWIRSSVDYNFLLSSCAGKIVNIRHLNEVVHSIDGWYRERGLFGLVSPSFPTVMCIFIFWIYKTISVVVVLLDSSSFSLTILFYSDQLCRSQILKFFQVGSLGCKFQKLRSIILQYVSLIGKRKVPTFEWLI